MGLLCVRVGWSSRFRQTDLNNFSYHRFTSLAVIWEAETFAADGTVVRVSARCQSYDTEPETRRFRAPLTGLLLLELDPSGRLVEVVRLWSLHGRMAARSSDEGATGTRPSMASRAGINTSLSVVVRSRSLVSCLCWRSSDRTVMVLEAMRKTPA